MSIQFQGICTLLEVFDMPTSIAFYRDVLGFEIITASPKTDPDWCWLRVGETELMLNTLHEQHDRPPAPDPGRVAAHGDTALFFGCEDLDSAFAHLRAHGLEVKPPVVRDYGMKQLSLIDPDGYNLCFQWPTA